jgi:putative membrane protein
MSDSDDPRIYFAAERTLLAWVRTGLAVIGLGFVVARFGLFLHAIRNVPKDSSASSTVIGVGLVLIGAISVAVAAWQHVRFCRQLPTSVRPKSYLVTWPAWFAVILSAVGIVLAVHLLNRSSW